MKKLKIILVILFVVFICGCTDKSAKTPITAEEFVDIAKSLKLEYTDRTKEFAYANAVYKITTSDYAITYVSGNKQYDMEGLFIDECANAMHAAGDDYDKKIVAGENWEHLAIEADNKYYYVSWIGSTYLNIESKLSVKDDVMEIAEKLGY